MADNQGFTFADEKEIKAAKDTILTPLNASGFLVLGYSNPTTIVLQAKSTSSDVEQMVSHIKEDQIQYCLIRLEEKYKDIANVNRQDGKKATRDIFISWIGPEVRTIEKGKKNSHIQAVAKFLLPHHAEITAVNKKNFTEANVRDRAAALSGSHVID